MVYGTPVGVGRDSVRTRRHVLFFTLEQKEGKKEGNKNYPYEVPTTFDGFGGAANPESLNLSLGWPSVWRAKVMVFHMFSIGFGGAENPESLNLSLGWPSVWRAKVMVFNRCSIGFGGAENPESLNLSLG